jgi:hypothetical protein
MHGTFCYHNMHLPVFAFAACQAGPQAPTTAMSPTMLLIMLQGSSNSSNRFQMQVDSQVSCASFSCLNCFTHCFPYQYKPYKLYCTEESPVADAVASAALILQLCRLSDNLL